MENTGILVVSFGTSYEENCEKTIGGIERRVQECFPDARVYRAFTSAVIISRLKKQGIAIFNIAQALEQMKKDGMTTVIVQPTHVIHGIENDAMMHVLKSYAQEFAHFYIGEPLLNQIEDYREIAAIFQKEYSLQEDEALVLVGHGTPHYANSAYMALEYVIREMGEKAVIIGTVEGYPTFAQVEKQLAKLQKKKVWLAPFLIVAGDHANNDIAGEEDSWKVQLQNAGYEVQPVLKGMGEYPAVQDMFVKHIKDALEER